MNPNWLERQEDLIDDWNGTHGTNEVPVRYWPGVIEGPGKTGMTRPFGAVLMGSTAVVYVYGAGAIALTHVEVRP